MLDQLHLRSFETKTSFSTPWPREVFSLTTCQRHLLIGLSEFPCSMPTSEKMVAKKGEAAYHYLLEVICGIQSRLLGENEIVKQFKQAYEEYLQKEDRQSGLIRILEKLFKDAKEVRTHYLKGVGQKTYAAITRKLIFEQTIPKRILIIGTGQLAQDVINQFKKKVEQIFISSRNREKVQEFCHDHLARPLQWKDFQLYQEFPFIINTIGVERMVLFDPEFFQAWNSLHPRKMFIDLGHPSIIATPLGIREGIIRLEHIFKQSAIREKEKCQRVQKAQKAIRAITQKRGLHLLKQTRRPSFV